MVPPLTAAAPTPKDMPPVKGAATMDANPVPITIFFYFGFLSDFLS